MDGKRLRQGTTFLIESSLDSKWNLNENSWNFLCIEIEENSLKNLGSLDLHEIWPASSWLHLIARKKINFHQKRIRNLNSTQKGKLD
jgi:hypothetical protein